MSTWLLDMDGVLWRGNEAISGSSAAIGALIARGDDVVYCTNHARSAALKEAELASFGMPAAPVITSAQAAASVCGSSDVALVLGHPSLVDLVALQGCTVLDAFDEVSPAESGAVTVVVVGGTERWERSAVGRAADAARSGARLIATNLDPTYPVTGPTGPILLPGNGALVAAVETAAGRTAESAGKPSPALAAMIRQRCGQIDFVVGDRPDTDGRLASELGARFALVLSGVSSEVDPAEPEPWLVAEDLAAVVTHAGADTP